MSTNTENNITSNFTNVLSQEKSGNSYLQFITTTNLFVTISCLIYIILKLKVNKHIKAILITIAIQNIFSLTVSTIANTIMIATRNKYFLACLSLSQSTHMVHIKSQKEC